MQFLQNHKDIASFYLFRNYSRYLFKLRF